jgi:hypothetical protein
MELSKIRMDRDAIENIIEWGVKPLSRNPEIVEEVK